MNVFEAVNNRRSIRNYLDKTVEEEKIFKIIEAARLSPSAANYQPWSFVVVKDKTVKERLSEAYPREWLNKAPVIFVACVDPRSAWRRKDGEEFWKVDAAIAVQNMVLVAYELGLGTCWICAFDEEKVKAAIGIPEEIRVVAITPVGYPAENKGPVTDRKNLSDIVHYDRWQHIEQH